MLPLKYNKDGVHDKMGGSVERQINFNMLG